MKQTILAIATTALMSTTANAGVLEWFGFGEDVKPIFSELHVNMNGGELSEEEAIKVTAIGGRKPEFGFGYLPASDSALESAAKKYNLKIISKGFACGTYNGVPTRMINDSFSAMKQSFLEKKMSEKDQSKPHIASCSEIKELLNEFDQAVALYLEK